MKNTVLILNRIKEHFMVGTNVELSEKWGIPTGTLDTWKHKDAIPNGKLMKLAKDENLSFDWLRTGESPKYKVESTPEPLYLYQELSKEIAQRVAEAIPNYGKDERTVKLCKVFDSLSSKDKDEVLDQIMPFIMQRT